MLILAFRRSSPPEQVNTMAAAAVAATNLGTSYHFTRLTQHNGTLISHFCFFREIAMEKH